MTTARISVATCGAAAGAMDGEKQCLVGNDTTMWRSFRAVMQSMRIGGISLGQRRKVFRRMEGGAVRLVVGGRYRIMVSVRKRINSQVFG